MKQCLFKDDHHPIRTIHVSLSIVHLAILSENTHYSKALGFAVYKKKSNCPFPYILLISECRHTSEILRFAFTPDLVQDSVIKSERSSTQMPVWDQFLTLKNSFTFLSKGPLAELVVLMGSFRATASSGWRTWSGRVQNCNLHGFSFYV